MVAAWDMVAEHFRVSMEVTPEVDRSVYPEKMEDFIEDVLGFEMWDRQRDIVRSVEENRYTSVASCHGGGKTGISARIVIAFLHCRVPSVVISTAPTARQVQNVLWREINTAHRNARKPLLGRCLTMRYEIAPNWYALGFKAATAGKRSDEADAWQGFHAENALVVIDEAAGVPESVFDTLEAVMSSENARQLLLGNPTSVSGTFRDSHHRNRTFYNPIKISAFDTPNLKADRTVIPALVTREWVETQIKKRGEKSPYVQSRIYANFPDLGINKLIPLSWIETANERTYMRSDEGRKLIAGVDVARYGDDESSLAVRRGPVLVRQHHWSGASITESANIVAHQLKLLRSEVGEIRVDAIGLGAGVADALRDKGFDVWDVNASNKSSDSEEWPNFRHEMWWQLRERFNIELPRIAVDKDWELDEDTIAQLSDIEYSHKDTRFTGALIEPKEETKKRTGWSPDRAEALALCYCTLPGPDIAAARPRAQTVRGEGWGNVIKSRGAKIARRRT
jgi:phage terminase large subunit